VIFVTVGTTLPFDDLVRFVDGMVERGDITEPVRCQIGPGTYEPQRCEWFRFKPELQAEIENASLVIGHGGTGTVTGLLGAGKPFVAVANPAGADNHQRDFLDRLSHVNPFLWTDRLDALPALIEQARTFRSEASPHLRLIDDLAPFLQDALERRGKRAKR
jgi:UDP-N-acetylglucosamine transferase subunit ALG13